MYIKVNNTKVHINEQDISYICRFDAKRDCNTNQIKALINIMSKIIDTEFTERQKQIIDLIVFKGLTQLAVAKQLGITQPTVNKIYRSAIDKLRGYLYFCNECLKNYILFENEVEE